MNLDRVSNTTNAHCLLVEKKLHKLGERPADVLRRLGITGQRGNYRACPIFNYLKRSMQVPFTVHSAHVSVAREWVLLPLSVEKFIRDFESGRYPDLEAITS